MSLAYIRTKWWIVFFCSWTCLLEISAPVEYVFGYLYVVPILLAACELDINRLSIGQRSIRSSQVTKLGILLTVIDFIISENHHLRQFSLPELPISIIVNRIGVVIVLLLANWLIHRNLKYLAEIYHKKEELVRAQADLLLQIRLDRMHEDFVYTLTHDLKTPLLGGIQTIDFFQKERFGSVTSTQSKILATMSRSHHRSLQLVETLLDIYRNDSEGLILRRQSIDLQVIAAEAIDLVGILGLKREITFDLKCDSSTIPLPELKGDRLQISRVFSNLLSNAIYHSHRGGRVEITIGYQKDRYNIQIVDRGDGINLDDLPFLFDRFYKARDRLKGSGLGLHLSQQIVEAHGGKIWAENISPQGAKFCFDLPIEI
jgi:two-component system, NarL family, sensor kinase